MSEKKYAIYARKSKFTGKGESVDNQIETCKNKLKEVYKLTDKEINKKVKVFKDEGFSGYNTARPNFIEMMKGCRKGEFGYVICYKIDRISRNVADFSYIFNELTEKGITFISATDNIASDGPMGKAMSQMIAVFAELERNMIAERIIDNMNEMAKRGRWLGGTTPLGYSSEKITYETADGKIKTLQALKQKPEEAEIVKKIYKKYLELGSLTQVEKYLSGKELNITTRNGNLFNRAGIREILKNPVYLINDTEALNYFNSFNIKIHNSDERDFDGMHGMIAYGRTKQTMVRNSILNDTDNDVDISNMKFKKKKTEFRDMSEWIIAIGDHEGIISGEDWVKVQKQLDEKTGWNNNFVKNNYALLSGVLVCKNCGAYMRPRKNKRILENGEHSFSYACETKLNTKDRCDAKRANGNALDEIVWKEIIKFVSESINVKQALASKKKNKGFTETDNKKQLNNLKNKEKEIEKKLNNILKAIETGKLDHIDIISKKMNELQQEQDEIQKSIIQKEKEINEAEKHIKIAEDFINKNKDIEKIFNNITIQQKQELVKKLITKIEYDGENIYINMLNMEPYCISCK